MKYLKRFISDIKNGENIDLYLTIVISLLIITLDIFGIVKFDVILSAVLAVLALLSFGTLLTRLTLNNINDSLNKFDVKKGAEDFLKTRDAFIPFNERISGAQNVYIQGLSAHSLLSSWTGYIKEKLQNQRANIQILILNPDSPVIESAAKNLDVPPSQLINEINSTLMKIQRISADREIIGSINTKVMSANPNHSMVLIDPDKPEGTIIVELIGYRSDLHKRPHFEFTKQKDGVWYEYFLHQYKYLWESAEVKIINSKDAGGVKISG